MSQETINDLKTRRSIRKFKNKQVSDEDLKIILEAGTYAPTGRGAQSPKIIVIQNQDTINEFSEWNKQYFPNATEIMIHFMVEKHYLLF